MKEEQKSLLMNREDAGVLSADCLRKDKAASTPWFPPADLEPHDPAPGSPSRDVLRPGAAGIARFNLERLVSVFFRNAGKQRDALPVATGG